MNMTPKAEALKNLDFQAFQALIGIEKKRSFPSLEAFIQYLREFDLHDILDIHSRCNCFFHEDVRPSANIYTYRGRSLYKCFAEGCPCRGKVLDLVGFYCALRGCSNAQALQELAQFFRADFPKTAPPKSRKRVLEILTKNQEIVSLLPTEAPWAYKILGTDLNTLDSLYRIAEEKAALLKPTRTGILLGESCQYIADHMERPPRMSQSLAVLAYFGLIDRPPFDELTTAQFSNTLTYYTERFRSTLSNSFDEDAVISAQKTRPISKTNLRILRQTTYSALEKRAKKWTKYRYKKKHFTYDAILQKEGPFAAAACYPQA